MDDEIDFAILANIAIDDELTTLAPAFHSRPCPLRKHQVMKDYRHLDDICAIVFDDGIKGNQPPSDAKPSGIMGMNFMKPFNGVQKKMTRGKPMCKTHTRDGEADKGIDGQPAKRRGPKPDSKPAQTRRQELNRQAQRTHRERKEQYIKALEVELSRLREGYTSDVAQMNMMLREHQEENTFLKELLTSRGIPFQRELEKRNAAKARNPTYGNSIPMQLPTMYNPMTSAPSPASGYSPQSTLPVMGSISGDSVSGATQHSYSPTDTGVFEQSIKHESPGVPEIPGIFETDPQLQVEFILALEATCRDHSEYLVRRSVNSPDDPEEALYSGHALMASCPPPNHISTVPADNHGLNPTYPHQVPQIPMANLTTLLNLSNRIKAEGLGGLESGQVTPVMALQSLRMHDRYHSLTRTDIVNMIDAFKNKIRCYGFGAVMEDFELRDALSSIFATKFETYEQAFGADDIAEVDAMYT